MDIATRAAGALILLVEDDVETAGAVTELLTREGYRVVRATHGEQAMKLLATGERPSLICCDLMMPVMSGWELVETLKRSATYSKIPVITWSGDDFSEDAVGDGFLRKPVSPQKLLRVVRNRLSAEERPPLSPQRPDEHWG